jgi:hypothetical protein
MPAVWMEEPSRWECSRQSYLVKRDVKKAFDSPASSINPLIHRNLYRNRVEKANKSAPLRPKSRLNISRFTRYGCIPLLKSYLDFLSVESK